LPRAVEEEYIIRTKGFGDVVPIVLIRLSTRDIKVVNPGSSGLRGVSCVPSDCGLREYPAELDLNGHIANHEIGLPSLAEAGLLQDGRAKTPSFEVRANALPDGLFEHPAGETVESGLRTG